MFQKLFSFEWKAQRWVVQHVWKKYKLWHFVDTISFVLFLLLGLIFAVKGNMGKIELGILAILGMVMMTCCFLKDAQYAMTSLGGFLRLGMCLMIVALFLILWIVVSLGNNIFAGIVGQYMACILISIVLSILWGIYSSFCNAGVATLANALLAGAIGLVILTVDLLTKTMLIDVSNAYWDESFTTQIESMGYSISQFVDGIFALVFYPFLLMTGFATMVCAAKKYWIDKYNKGQDVESLVSRDCEADISV